MWQSKNHFHSRIRSSAHSFYEDLRMKYTFSAITLAATLGLATAIAVEPRQSASFVKTKGQQFTLDGQKFTVVGVSDFLVISLGFCTYELFTVEFLLDGTALQYR
jgi:hypothetical protein